MSDDNDLDWRHSGLCIDSDLDFFTEDTVEKRAAKQLCVGCPVRFECINDALQNEDRFGIWGGIDETALRRTLAVDKEGRPVSRKILPQCPYCREKKINTVEKRRTRSHMECSNCGLSWWMRRPAPQKKKIEKVDAE